MESLYKEFRCKNCEKLLFKGLLIESQIEIKCKRCKELNTFVGDKADILVCLNIDCLNRLTMEKISKKKAGQKAEP